MDIGVDITDVRSLVDTGAAGGNMVFVKVRETYDLQTVPNKMTVIGIHTPKPDIIKANFPGLLMQCKAYRPVSCDVALACASTLPVDPLGVGTATGDVAPEDLFNPILYKAISNIGMSQIEARITANSVYNPSATGVDLEGPSVQVDVDTLSAQADEFPIYYGLLADSHGWKHANPQQGLVMEDLRPYVFEVLANVGDNRVPIDSYTGGGYFTGPSANGVVTGPVSMIRGNAKPLPFMNCTSYSTGAGNMGFVSGSVDPGKYPDNHEMDVPWINAMCGCIIVPPSKLHELYFRMTVVWTLEFSQIRSVNEITDWTGLGRIADITHYQNYSYASAKAAEGIDADVMDKESTMVSSNVDIKKVM